LLRAADVAPIETATLVAEPCRVSNCWMRGRGSSMLSEDVLERGAASVEVCTNLDRRLQTGTS
jgi:hypothetical protein